MPVYCNTTDYVCQDDTLIDTYLDKFGRVKRRPWRAKKMTNMMLAQAYDNVDKSKATRLRACATYLTFDVSDVGALSLTQLNSCRVRLCPMCQWRRSLKNYYNNYAIAKYLDDNAIGGAWIAITLTVRNCTGEDLSTTIDQLLYAFKRLRQLKRICAVVKGTYRGLEVTHDSDEFISPKLYRRKKAYYVARGLKVGDRNPTYDTYHPHIHALLRVNKSYFVSRDYIPLVDWIAMWRDCLDVDYDPSIRLQRVKSVDDVSDKGGKFVGEIAEISKYSVKDTDYIIPDDWDLTTRTVATLDNALAGRQLIGYSGCCLDAKRALKIVNADSDTADLINVGGDKVESKDVVRQVSYFWDVGWSDYRRHKQG